MTALQAQLTFEPKCHGTITDYKYSQSGQYLAIADSQGYIYIHCQKDTKNYTKIHEFKADEGSLWSLAWADHKYGNVIGVGSFRNKVAIFQEIGGTWREIAYHQLHTGSVNWVEFAQFGLKLYAGSSDGQVSILELSQKSWKSSIFTVGENAITTIALQQFPLGETFDEDQADKVYPRIATATKDQKIKIWAHLESQSLYNDSPIEKKPSKSAYTLLRQLATPKQSIRTILWQPTWQSLSESLQSIRLLTCCEEGQIKSLNLSISSPDADKITTIYSSESQVIRISQCLTGNLLTASLCGKNHQQILVLEQVEEQEWKTMKKGKL